MAARLMLHLSTLVAAGALLWSYGTLPPRVAIHFNFAGKPDAWASKTTYLIFGLGMLALMWLLFAGLPRLIEKTPKESINVPNKEHWLSPEHIDEFRSIFSNYMYFYGGVTQLLFLGIGVLAHMAQRAHAHLSMSGMFALLGAYVAITVVWLVMLVRRFRR